MYLLTKYGGHRSDRNEDVSSYINSYMNILEKAELTTPIRHIARFLKSGIPIYNFEVPEYGCQKNKKKEKNTGNWKVFGISRKREKAFDVIKVLTIEVSFSWCILLKRNTYFTVYISLIFGFDGFKNQRHKMWRVF